MKYSPKNGLILDLINLQNQPDYNLVLAQSHFIKTVEDVHELVVNCVPGAKFGLAFNEASGPLMIRTSGTEPKLIKEAVRLAKLIGCGHLLVLVMTNVYPINILPRLSDVPEIVSLYCATANPVQVVVAASQQGRGVLGVIDGGTPKGVESGQEITQRQQLLRQMGYKQ
ncbi:adenosine monophosphate-protein transferase [Microgenomates group bacterium RBG_16_45_19]|nr:MAG: adenosine monophosphate-protein transferase [Microgenomates group bacterium RBG_16_45_19]